MWLVGKANRNHTASENMFGFEVITSFSERFSNDKVFLVLNNGFVIHDGITLNKNELIGSEENKFSDWIIENKKKNNTFFSRFIGPFSGCYYDDNNKALIAYGNQTGDAAIYYYSMNGIFAVSSDFNMLFNWCSEKGVSLTFNTVAANHMLSMGFLTEGNTIAIEIKKQNPGEYIFYKDNQVQVKTYHRFVFGDYSISDFNAAIKLIDKTFKLAVKRCFDKDLEYGYKRHLADISGGLDSRMTNWIAKDLGYSDVYNICYAQGGSREQEYGEMVSHFLGNDFCFEPLDYPYFIFDLEKLVKMNYGQALYCGITGGEKMLSCIDFNKYGLEHTGQLGDVIVGYKENVLGPKGEIDTASISYSGIVKPILNDVKKYKNGEEFAFYYRFFHGTLATHYTRRHFTEAVSPFIDPDFLQLCMHISPKLRKDHKLYWKWIKDYYPRAASIPSTRNRGNFRMNIYHTLPKRVSRTIIKVCKSVGLTSIVSDKRSMNPIDLWYANIPEVREFIEDYYLNHKEEISSFKDVAKSLDEVFHGERVEDKMLALTVLGSYHVYFSKD